MSDMQREPAGATPAPRPSSGGAVWKALTVLLAVACAVLGFLLLRSQQEGVGDGLTATADSSAALSCEILSEATAAGFTGNTDDENFIQMNRLTVAQTLAYTAAAHDPSFETFEEAMRGPRAVAAREFSTEGPKFDEALADAQAACEDQLNQE